MNNINTSEQLVADGENLLASRIPSRTSFIYDQVDSSAYNQWAMSCIANLEILAPTHAKQIKAIYMPAVPNVNLVQQILGVVRSAVEFIAARGCASNDSADADNPENYNTSYWTSEVQDKCQRQFLTGAYDEAIFNATKVLEVTVRKKADLKDSDIGKHLIQKAFKPSEPIIKYSNIKDEQISFMNLLMGLIGVFKNPQSHRFVGEDSPFAAYEIIGFVSHVQRVIDSLVQDMRRPEESGEAQ